MQVPKPLITLIFSTALTLAACGEKPESVAVSSENPESSASVSEATPKEPVAKPKVNRGASLYKRCRTCHTLNEGGAQKIGPNLYGIFGAKAGQKEGFRYSSVMKDSGLVWTDENLTAYIKNPRKFMPGNSMAFAGIRKDEDIALILEYMREKASE